MDLLALSLETKILLFGLHSPPAAPPFCDTNVQLWFEGVTVLAVGINQASTEELRRVVTDASTQNILYASGAAQLNTLHADLADLLCGVARIPEVVRKN